ncbi:MAG: tetratricopeptide repeat protein [Candidatus Omnitrophota bacterium]
MEHKTHSKGCACGHAHGHRFSGLIIRWVMSVFIISGLLLVLRPFIIQQMLTRVAAYFNGGSYNNAIRVCKKIVFIDRKNIPALKSLGYAYEQNGEIDEAIATYEKVVSLNPMNKGACFDLGMAYFTKKEFARALPYFEQIRVAGPDKGKTTTGDFLNYHRGALTILLRSYQELGNVVKVKQIEQEEQKYYPKESHGRKKVDLLKN